MSEEDEWREAARKGRIATLKRVGIGAGFLLLSVPVAIFFLTGGQPVYAFGALAVGVALAIAAASGGLGVISRGMFGRR